MRFLKLAVVCGFAAFASACGTSGMGPGDGDGGGGGGTNPTPASVTVSNTATGTFSVAISTSFQPADWDYQFFQLNPTATTTLGNLGSRHVRLQGIVHGVPQGSEGTSSTAWDFSMLDAITQPVLGTGDHSPEFQIAKAPAFMYSSNNSGSSFVDTSFTEFAGYAQNLVRYYNTGGFTANGRLYDSPAFANNRYKVTWWGIYNEPSINNNLDADLYTTMLVGLSSKNAILIVEFAEQLREQGMPLIESAVQAATIRLRPILMTSLAFILGVVPLVVASGAGENGRHSVGTTVFGGMIMPRKRERWNWKRW